MRIFHMHTPSPYIEFGIKGMGDSGAIAPPAAIFNAVNDALAALGVELAQTPLTPRRLRAESRVVIQIGLTLSDERVNVDPYPTNYTGETMATNPKALELARQGKVEYEWGTLWPHYHKEKMNWGGGFRTKGDVDILFLSGETGRDPFEDAPCRTPEEERAGRGKVMSHDVKAQTRQCLEYIKNKLEMMDASLKHIVMFRYYLPRREDVFDMRDEMYRFFEEFEPDLRAHPRPATLLRGVGIDLKEMLVEIEAWAVVPRQK